MMALQELSDNVIRLIGSCQIITSIHSVVKELIENAIDAGATSIDIKLEQFGLDKIEVRDNGSGINVSEMRYVCLSHYTSKIHSFEDLEKLQSYGFRGEALHSLCAVSDVVIITRTQQDDVAHIYYYDKKGEVYDRDVSHHTRGTIVKVTNLFTNVPVRREYCSKNRSYELQKIERVIKVLAVIHTKLRITLSHNKCLIWQKTETYTIRDSLMQAYPRNEIKTLVDRVHTFGNITLEMLLPQRDCNISTLCISLLRDAVLFFVNKRPVVDKTIQQFIYKEMTSFYASAIPRHKFPICVISVSMPSKDLDVNLDPDKSSIIIVRQDEIMKYISEAFSLHFNDRGARNNLFAETIVDNDESEKSVKKFKQSETSNLHSKSTRKSLSDKLNFESGTNANVSCDVKRDSTVRFNNIQFVDINDKKMANFSSDKSRSELELFPELVAKMNKSEHDPTKSFDKVDNSKTNISSDRCTLSQWSKGAVLVNGENVQGTNLIFGTKKNIADNFKYALKDNKDIQFKVPVIPKQKNVTDANKGNLNCFSSIAREIRNDIVEMKDTDISFTKVANELASKSRSLCNGERMDFIQKISKLSPRHSRNVSSVAKKSQSPRQNLKNVKKGFSYEITVQQIEEKIRKTRTTNCHVATSKKNCRLLTDDKSDFKWLCRSDEEIGVINVGYLQEIVLQHQNLCTASLPLYFLEIPVTILESDIGKSMWDLLLSLNRRNTDCSGIDEITDPRLIKNGYKIELQVDAQDCIAEMRIRCIFKPYLGEEFVELKEILYLITKHKDLLNCRTFRASYFILEDTAKQYESLPLMTDGKEVQRLLNYWMEHVKTYRGHFMSDKQVFVRLHSF